MIIWRGEYINQYKKLFDNKKEKREQQKVKALERIKGRKINWRMGINYKPKARFF